MKTRVNFVVSLICVAALATVAVAASNQPPGKKWKSTSQRDGWYCGALGCGWTKSKIACRQCCLEQCKASLTGCYEYCNHAKL